MSIYKWSAYKLKYGFDDATEETLILKKKKDIQINAEKENGLMITEKDIWWSYEKSNFVHHHRNWNNNTTEENSVLEKKNCQSTNEQHRNRNMVLMLQQKKLWSWRDKLLIDK